MRRLVPTFLLVGMCIALLSSCAPWSTKGDVEDIEVWVEGNHPANPSRPGAQQWIQNTHNFLIEMMGNQCSLITAVNGMGGSIPVPSWCPVTPPPPPLPPCQLGSETC